MQKSFFGHTDRHTGPTAVSEPVIWDTHLHTFRCWCCRWNFRNICLCRTTVCHSSECTSGSFLGRLQHTSAKPLYTAGRNYEQSVFVSLFWQPRTCAMIFTTENSLHVSSRTVAYFTSMANGNFGHLACYVTTLFVHQTRRLKGPRQLK